MRNLVLLTALLVISMLPVQAANLAKISRHTVYLENNFLHLQAIATVQLSKEMRTAIYHNIPLTFVWKIKIDKNRSWYVWDKKLYNRELTRKLYFSRALGQYALQNINNRKVEYFLSLDEAIFAMAQINIINLLPIKKLQPGNLYTSSIRLELKARSLPAMMILRGAWSADWEFDTGWYLKRFNL